MAKIIYEPHPVNPSRKAKLLAQGYKILDANFAPAGTPVHQELDDAAVAEPVAEPAVEAAAEPEAEDTLVAYETEPKVKKAPAKQGQTKKG